MRQGGRISILSQTLCTNFFEVDATIKLQGCNFIVMALILYLEEATDGRTNIYPQHSAPTSFEVGATRKLQGCNFLVRSLLKLF